MYDTAEPSDYIQETLSEKKCAQTFASFDLLLAVIDSFLSQLFLFLVCVAAVAAATAAAK